VRGDSLVEPHRREDALHDSASAIYEVNKTEAAKAVHALASNTQCTGALRALGIDRRPIPARSRANAPLAGLLCTTGTLSRAWQFEAESRPPAVAVQDAVTKNTRYLVAGANVGATKLNTARSLGTEILDESGLSRFSPAPSRPLRNRRACPSRKARRRQAPAPNRQQNYSNRHCNRLPCPAEPEQNQGLTV
jgi:hypothetical protein